MKRRDRGIQSLAHQFNRLCERMGKAIKERKAPANAMAPRPIPTEELFKLDVNDVIWDDSGLSDCDTGTEVPLWLSDEQVRVGIKGILLQDRCDEELDRLKHELHALGEWFSEEWEVIVCAMSATDGMS